MTRREQLYRSPEPECRQAQAALEARLVSDGVLDASREEALHAHLGSCEACADFDKIARHLGELPPVSTEMVRIRSVVAAKRIYFARRRKRRAAIGAIAVAAAVVLVLALFPVLFSANDTDTDGESGQRLASGERLQLLEGRVTLFSNPQTDLKIVLKTDDTMHVRLQNGFMCANIDPAPNRRVHFRVVTPMGNVDIKGTAFGVTVADGRVRVAVIRGEVAANPTDSARIFSVRAGSVFDIDTQRTMPIDDDLARHICTLLGLQPTRTGTSEENEPEISTEDVFPEEAPVEAISPKPKSQALRESHPSLETLLDEADKCRIGHDWGCAAKRYGVIVKRFPHRAEARTALITLGQIQLKHLEKPKEARRNFKRYQRFNPSGPLSEQALMGIARANRSLGDRRGEARALHLFVARHPSSPLTEAARQRLAELEKIH